MKALNWKHTSCVVEGYNEEGVIKTEAEYSTLGKVTIEREYIESNSAETRIILSTEDNQELTIKQIDDTIVELIITGQCESESILRALRDAVNMQCVEGGL